MYTVLKFIHVNIKFKYFCFSDIYGFESLNMFKNILLVDCIPVIHGLFLPFYGETYAKRYSRTGS